MGKLRIGSFFSGIGAFEKALERLEIPHEIAFYCEIDKYASQSYSLIHNVPESFNLWDITKVDETKLPDFDLMTWGFPCQDISVAGKQAGVIEGETRSGLYYDGIRILRHKKPKYSIIENVKNLTSETFRPVFYQILCDLEDAGYKSYWQVLNAKDYGVPQNRERVFIISIRNGIECDFDFPVGFDNGIRLKDLLEDEVDEKYYVSQEKTEKLLESLIDKKISNTIRVGGKSSFDKHQWDLVAIPVLTPDREEARQQGRRFKDDGEPMFSLTTQDRHGILQIGNIYPSNGQNSNIYDINGISPTISSGTTNTKGNGGIGSNNAPKILEKSPNPELVGGIGEINFGKQYRQGNRVYSSEKTAMALMSQPVGNTGGNSYLYFYNYRIRKLTPLECFRLMGFDDEDFKICKDNGISDSQLYKMAGNSIVVRVLEKIMENLFMGNAVSCMKQLALFG